METILNIIKSHSVESKLIVGSSYCVVSYNNNDEIEFISLPLIFVKTHCPFLGPEYTQFKTNSSYSIEYSDECKFYKLDTDFSIDNFIEQILPIKNIIQVFDFTVNNFYSKEYYEENYI